MSSRAEVVLSTENLERVNAILETVTEQVKQFLATGIVGEIDQDLGRLDDMAALWSVRKARETAYTNAEYCGNYEPRHY